MKQQYDLAVVGAGSVGLIAADFARKLGASVVLLERNRIGGDCTWTGCVPSKSLVRVARAAHEVRSAARFGLTPRDPVVDMAYVRAYLRSTIDRIDARTTPEALQQKGIDVVFGTVRFVNAHELCAGERRIRAEKVVIGTGAQPVVPLVEGLRDVPYVTYRTIFDNERLPGRMAVIGGGPIAVEIAQAYARLGVRVTIFAERLLPKEEPEAVEIVERVLAREGVGIVRERARSVERAGAATLVRSAHADARCDLLLVAAGRRPVIGDLNLEAAGVRYSERGIQVDDRLRTSAKTIYAAGDVIGGAQFSHLAGWQGFHAARNALLPGASSGVPRATPRVTFCDPEVAQVGQTEAEARAEDPKAIVTSWPIEREDRAICDDDRDGIIKIIASRKGVIRGATVVGHRAGDAIMELVIAVQRELSIVDLAGTIHPYPTYASGIQLLASDMAVERALHGMPGKVIRALSRFRRWRGGGLGS